MTATYAGTSNIALGDVHFIKRRKKSKLLIGSEVQC